MESELLFSIFVFGQHLKKISDKSHLDKMMRSTMLWLIQKQFNTASILSQVLALKPSTITEKIDDLEQQKLISLSPNVNDRRSMVLKLTDEGKQVLSDSKYHINQYCVNQLHGLNLEEKQVLSILLNKLLSVDNILRKS